MFWKLMPSTNISTEEKQQLIEFISTTDKFTQGEQVLLFEKEWSSWQNCKYSVFVNSGSSANLILIKSLTDLYGRGGLICQATTWPTNINPGLQLKNISFVQLCDNNLTNFGFDFFKFKHYVKTVKPKYVFLTHVLGFNSLSSDIVDLCNEENIILIEDCCEAHGAHFKNTKVGNNGLAGTFSFYYGHHMTTIEGGIISTNNEELYHQLLLNRSHGFLREHPKANEIPSNCDRRFSFLTDGFNVRNTEINALLGRLQLPKLNNNIKIRNENLFYFLQNLNSDRYYSDFNIDGISSFAFPVITKQNNVEKLKQTLTSNGIENRPFIAGNLANQTYLQNINMFRDFPNSDILHFSGMYLGNNQFVTKQMIDSGLNLLNN